MTINRFQLSVDGWMQECFGPIISNDKVERNYRFLEEALELVQSCGCTKEDALKLVDYVFNRPVGDPMQEVGGVMITLAALTTPNHINLEIYSSMELDRILQPEIMQKIREKQASKKIKGGTLP